MIKKLEVATNEKGEITSPTYLDIVSKINEIIEEDEESIEDISDSWEGTD